MLIWLPGLGWAGQGETICVNPAERSFSDSLFQEIQAEKEYQSFLEMKTPPSRPGVNRFVSRILHFLMNSKILQFILSFLPYALIILAVLLILFRITRFEVSKIFKPAVKNYPSRVFIEEGDGYQTNIDQQLREALKEKHHRLALRYYYLKILKVMDDQGLIQWKPYKSNHEYQTEISQKPFYKEFRELSRAYEYIWYGEFPVSEFFYEELFARAEEFLNRLDHKTRRTA